MDVENERFLCIELSVCVVCIHLLANGEYNDGTDAADKADAGQQRIWGSDVGRILVPGGGREDDDGERGYSTSACEGCGDTHHGDRHQAYAMFPKMGPYVGDMPREARLLLPV